MGIIKVNNCERENGRTVDSIKYNKQCPDFVVLDDGSLVGEYRYCNLSLQCRQIDIGADAQPIPMEANYLSVYDIKGKLAAEELFCTGMYDLRSIKERINDEKVS